MGQVKKKAVREAILRSAERQLSRKGYARTTMKGIARGARVSTANVYVYFRSKLEILYALYDPWLRERFARLEEAMLAARTPRERVRLLLRALWHELPSEKNGFANNIMQAISTATPRDRYKPTLLRWMEASLERLLKIALPAARRRRFGRARVAHLLVMAFDGFIVYHHLDPQAPLDEATLEASCLMLLGRR